MKKNLDDFSTLAHLDRYYTQGKEVKFLGPESEKVKPRPMLHPQATVELRTEPCFSFPFPTAMSCGTLALLAAPAVASTAAIVSSTKEFNLPFIGVPFVKNSP